MKFIRSLSIVKKGLIHAAFGLILLASSSVLLYFLDGQRTTVARAEQLAYLPKGEYLKLAVLGYRQVVEHLRGERSLPETIELVKIRTRQFAKRQFTWFRRQMNLKWIPLTSENFEAVVATIAESVAEK